jgi:hypothetical protein
MRRWILCAVNFLPNLAVWLHAAMLELNFGICARHWSTGGTGRNRSGENRRTVTPAGIAGTGAADGVAGGVRFCRRGEDSSSEFWGWSAAGGRSGYGLEIRVADARGSISRLDQ